MLDARFGLDQQARIDYAFNAVDKVTLAAKALVARFYGRDAERSYFLGCSNGGRQGMLAAQRYPAYFDGIVAGAPVFNLSRIVVNQIWNVQVVSRLAPRDTQGQPILSRAFSDSDLKRVADATLEACDALDGLADGMINDWRACPFDPKVLTCADQKTDRCLTTEQVAALRDLTGGARNSRGEPLYGRFPYDTGIAMPVWRRMRLGTSTTAKSDASDVVLGVEALRYYMLTPPDPQFDPLRFDFDRDLPRTRQMQAFTDADATYLRGFAQHGKMILYHGVSDQGMAAGALTDWYDKVITDTGARTPDFARLFFVPGMTHCGGGQSTDRFDMLTAIQAWVEEGRAPDRIVATGAAFPGVSRPLCPYPSVARYVGGDVTRESSFQCRN
jgi:feruloyl esterase